jgi:hypothetical protein
MACSLSIGNTSQLILTKYMLNLIGILAISIFFSFLFVIIGKALLTIPDSQKGKGTSLIVSCSYFLGMAFFLSIWRTFSFITNNAVISLLGTLISSIITIYFFGKQTYKPFFFEFLVLVKSKCVLLISLFIFIFVVLFWVGPFEVLSPFTIIGSLHSPRYSNFATYILEFNRIPVLGQNYGQSMLAAIPMIIGFNSPLLSLNIWLSITLIYFTFLVYSMCLHFNFTIKFAILATFIILFGNTAISIFHILCIDSGSPFILNGYTDSIGSIGTFIVVFFFLKNAFFTNAAGSTISKKETILLFSLSVYWNIAAPQNSMFFGAIIGLFLLYTIKKRRSIFKPFKTLILFLAFSCIGIVEGGMYTPPILKEKIGLPGMMEIGEKGIGINPGIPFYIGFVDAWEYGNKNVLLQGSKIKHQLKLSSMVILIISVSDQLITNGLKVIFWPLFGILGLFIMIKLNHLKNGNLLSKQLESDYNILSFIAFSVFLIGLLLNSFISISGYKWELSRFLIIGYFLGMFCLVISLNFLFRKRVLSKVGIYFFVILITIGPVVNSFANIFANIFYTKNSNTFFEKINVLINTSGMIK